MAEELSKKTEEGQAAEDKTTNAFLSPEGIIMLGLAIAVDGLEFVLDIIPQVLPKFSQLSLMSAPLLLLAVGCFGVLNQ